MQIVHAFVLGVLQGITEFLPISSSGHLILLPKILGWQDQGLSVDAVLHLTTALAIFVYFRKEWWAILKKWRKGQAIRKIVIASIPAALLGFLLKDFIEQMLRSPWVIVVMLILVAIFMLWVEANYVNVTVKETKKKNMAVNIDWPEALLMGLAQPLALIPGTSRSGITMSIGMFKNVNRVEAAKFSFLLGAPITLGAGLVKLPDLVSSSSTNWAFVFTAAITTFIVALASMHWLLNFLKGHTLKPFAYYRIVLSILVAALLIFKVI